MSISYTTGDPCRCDCHSLGVPFIKTSMPPQACCDCNEPKKSTVLSDFEKRIIKLEERIFSTEKDMNLIPIPNLELTKLEEMVERLSLTIQAMLIDKNKKPQKCPVCEGMKVHKRMLSHDGQLITIEENCICCEGKGVVWG